MDKKVLKIAVLLTTLVMGVFSVNAQGSTFQNLQFEGVAGLNMSDMGGLGSKAGLHIGAKAEMPLPSLADGAYANAGVLLSFKGNSYLGLKTTANYLEIPMHVGYKHAINENLSIFGEAGPYIAFGLFGKMDVMEVDILSSTDVIQINTFDSEFGLNRFDIGVGLKAGVEIKKKYTVSIGYDWGFIDAYKNSPFSKMEEEEEEGEYIDLTPKMTNTNLSISLGYKF
jgi:hypothetical protein